MPRIVGAFVRKRATTSAREAKTYARTWGKATGRVRETSDGFAIGQTTGRKREVSSDLCVYVK